MRTYRYPESCGGRTRRVTATPSAFAPHSTLNALKDAGEPLPLIVMGNAYTVVISDFTWGFIRYPQYAEFHVSCVVVDGYGLSSIVADAASLANLVAADSATATALF